jgi:malonyl CoA-acyl carrier protein transacylase
VFITSRGSNPKSGKLAVLFSGQGAQYPDMLREVAVTFRELPDRLTEAERILRATPTFQKEGQRSVSRLIYPPDRFTPEEERSAQVALTRTEIAQPALGAIEMGLWDLVRALEIRADMVAGHSYGEYAALSAADVLSLEDLLLLSEARGRCIVEAAMGGDLGTMAAVPTDGESIGRMLDSDAGVVCANLNGPEQTIISGSREAVKDAIERLEIMGQSATFLPVAAGFHSPLMEPAKQPFTAVLATRHWRRPTVPVYSNTTARPHSGEPAKIRAQLANHLVEPVDFVGMIEAMYDGGARTFLELGPKSILGDLVGTILRGRPHLSVSVDGRGGGLQGFLTALATLFVEGVPLSLDRLFEGRSIPPLNLDDLTVEADAQTNRRRTWLINGSGVRPAEAPIGGPASKQKEGDSTGPAIPQAPSRPRQPNDAAEQSQSPGVGGIQHENHAGAQPAHQDKHQDKKSEEVFELTYDRNPSFSPPGNGIEQIMNDYHQTMRQFLQMQERVMMTYLAAPAGEGFSNTSAPMDLSPTQSLPMPMSSSCSVQPSTVGGAQPHATTNCAAPELDSLSARGVLAEHTAPPTPPPAHGKGNGNGQSEVDTPDFRATLLGIVSERTGYPEDMLDLGQDLEADLGIDSIKRVEILGNFRKSLPASMGERLRDHMEGLNSARSLGAILDFVEGTLGKETLRPFDPAGAGDVDKACAPLPRYRMRAHAEPVPTHNQGSLPRGLYLLTPDETGTAAALSRRLEAGGLVPVVIPAGVLADEQALVQWLVEQRSNGPFQALVHLTPLDGRPLRESDGLDDWRGRIERDVKSLFSLLSLLAGDLMTGGCVITTSAMGGRFGRDFLDHPERPGVFPSGAGNVGLIKALGFEWPDCACKTVDLDPSESTAAWAEHIYAELAWRGSRPEVGYPGGKRAVFVTDSAILSEEPVDDRRPDEHWVVLAVGGARGITAETLRPLAEGKATLVLVGRSAFPKPESVETHALISPETLRSHFFKHAADTGESVTPVAIEKRVRAVLAAREMRANVEDFERMGARVDYRCVDTRSDADVGALFDSIYATYGRIDAVIHGGGVIEDHLLINKSQDSVNRVFDTKADTAFLLARHLRTETLKFVAFYTSVAGRYGNAGQTDYAAANETLNRFAWVLQARWGSSVKVSAINWGPWDVTTNGSGMVTPETRRKFERNGVVLVEAKAGRDFLIREITHSSCDDVEVIAGDGPWRQDIAKEPQPSGRQPDAATGPRVAPHATSAGGEAA